MAETQRPSLNIRLARPEDIPVCAHLNAAYQTNYVWQMHFQDNERTVQSTFTQVRLPRTMLVERPYNLAASMMLYEQSPHLLVVGYGEEIVGCVSGAIETWRAGFVISSLIVLPQIRQKGVGTMLFKAIRDLALDSGCKQVTVTVQTKNHPAIEFAQKQGFVFCGYNDRYYPNGDIALMLSLVL